MPDPSPATVARRPPLLLEAATMSRRGLLLSLRNIDGLVMALALPVMLMLVFVYLLGGAISTGDNTPYVRFALPGVLLICVGFGAGATAVGVAADLTTAAVDRFRSLDLRPASLIGGHVAAGILRNLASTGIVVSVAFAIGYRSPASPLDWLAAAGVLSAYLVALSWWCAALGVAAQSPEAANGFTFLVSFLPYVSSAVVPIETMPTWLQAIARNQPLTPVIDSLRNLLAGQPAGDAPIRALVWSTAIALASIALASTLHRRRFSRR